MISKSNIKTEKSNHLSIETIESHSKSCYQKTDFTALRFRSAFTIVELLVVIVVIGILASITIVSYNGIFQKTKAASIQADLSNADKIIKLFQVENSFYPYQINDCPSPTATNLCINPSNNATYDYTVNNSASPQTYTLVATADDNTTKYQVSENGGVIKVAASFVVSWGGDDWENASGLIQTTDGGYAMSGQTGSYGAGSWDAFLAKYAADGTLSWSRTWGGTGADTHVDKANSLDQTSDGGYIIAGSADSYDSEIWEWDNYAFLAKYTADGTLSWSRTWGGASGMSRASSVIQTSDGGYAIAGYTDSYGAGSEDAFIAKYTADGTLSWSRTWGGINRDRAIGLIQTSADGYAIVGYTSSFGDGSGRAFLAKYTADGTLSWSRTWGQGGDSAYSIAQTLDGGYVIAGGTDSFGAGDDDAFFAKYTADGTLSWSRTWGGVGYEEAYSVIQTSDGGYGIAGVTDSYGAGSEDAFIAKYTADGTLSWSRTWGGVETEGSYSLIQLTQTSDGGYVIAGDTESYGAGNNDTFIAKYTADGNISSCASPMCQVPTPSVSSPTPLVLSPSATVSSPTVIVSSPNTISTSPSATNTIIVAP